MISGTTLRRYRHATALASLSWLAALLTLPACGSDAKSTDAAGGGTGSATGPLLPWAVGNKWTYRVTDSAGVTDKTTTILAEEAVGGDGPNKDLMAYRVETRKGTDLTDKTESFQAPDSSAPDRILRYRELSYGAKTGLVQLDEWWDPSRVHIDGTRATADNSFLDAYTEYKLNAGDTVATSAVVHDLWNVISIDEPLDVPKGHFAHTIHFEKIGGSTKDYWYARGVGKLKETGSQTEELVDYTLGSPVNGSTP